MSLSKPLSKPRLSLKNDSKAIGMRTMPENHDTMNTTATPNDSDIVWTCSLHLVMARPRNSEEMDDIEFVDALRSACWSCTGDRDIDLISEAMALLAENRPHLDLSQCLSDVSTGGDNVKLARLLLHDPRFHADHDECAALIAAAQNGRLGLISLFLATPQVDPNAGDCLALDIAIECGHIDAAKRLLSDRRVDPSLEDNRALFGAIHDCEYELVDIILADARVQATLNREQTLGWADQAEDERMLDQVRRALDV